jgi:hypothetical protein
MANAQGSRQRTLAIKEASWGVTPTTPVGIIIPVSKNGLVSSRATLEDDTLLDTRALNDLRLGMTKVAGPLDAKFRFADYDGFLESALFGTWATNTLKAGVTPSSYTIEKGLTDIAQYFLYTGAVVNKMTLSIKPDSLIPITFDWVGKGRTLLGTSMTASPTAASTNAPFDSFTGSIIEGGSAIATITGIELSLDNQLTALETIFVNQAVGITAGRRKITGTMSALFQDNALISKVFNETSSSIVFKLVDLAGKNYTFTLPKIMYTGGDPSVDTDKEVPLTLPFTAIYDTTLATDLQIVKALV